MNLTMYHFHSHKDLFFLIACLTFPFLFPAERLSKRDAVCLEKFMEGARNRAEVNFHGNTPP